MLHNIVSSYFLFHFKLLLQAKQKNMDYVLIVFGAVFIIVGLLGCVLPVIPGPPLGFVGLLLLHFTEKVQFETNQLLIWAFIAIAITVIDNILPVWTTKKFGGSKAGVWGSTIGLIFGLFIGPWGIIIGPFLGAIIGEMINNNQDKAIKAGIGAFMGFVCGVGIKLACSGYFAWLFFTKIF